MNQQQQNKRKGMESIEEKEEKKQRRLRECKTLFEGVMKRCRKMSIKDVKHTVLSTKEAPKEKGECWEVIAQTSLTVMLDEKYEFSGVSCVQTEMPFSKGFVTNCALSTSCRSAEEDAFKKIYERLAPLESSSSSSSFLKDNNANDTNDYDNNGVDKN
jgi:hypothetical protein